MALGAALAMGAPAGADDLEDRIDRMERDLQEMKRELQRRKAGAPPPAERKRTPSASSGQSPTA